MQTLRDAIRHLWRNIGFTLTAVLTLGIGIGLLLSLVLEFLNRRVRGPEDLMHGLEVPLLGIITTAKSRKQPRSALPGLRGALERGRRSASAV